MSKSGRPEKKFSEKSLTSQRKDASKLSTEVSNNTLQLLMAAKVSAKRNKDNDLASVISEVLKTPTIVKKIRTSLTENNVVIKVTPAEAMAYLIDNNLSKSQYHHMHMESKRRNADIWPRYELVRMEKEQCYPKGIIVSDITATVPLQNFLEHRVKRLIEMQVEVIEADMQQKSLQCVEATLISSWGFDGSSDHSTYNQHFNSSGESVGKTDTNLIATTTIPLRLVAKHGAIYWCNRTPQSIRFCSPIMLEYKKETPENIIATNEKMKEQIKNLRPITYEFSSGNRKIIVSCSFFCTLIDGKVLSILTGSSGFANCPICHAKPNQMNEITNFGTPAFEPKPDTLQYGLSTLHMWIRFFECLLHISYRIELKVWKVTGDKAKNIIKERKKQIQERFREKFSMSVDQPRSGGVGTSTTGNVSRRAFEKPELLAEILDLDVTLVKNFRTILLVLNSQLPVDPIKFQKFCFDTAKIFNEKYGWYKMPSAVHKTLAHGAQIILNSLLPVGVFGEDAAESRNKYYRNDRLYHARKTSRVDNLTDMFKRALASSDIIISSISLQKRINTRKRKHFPPEVIDFLVINDTNFDINLKDDDILDVTSESEDEDECNFELENIVFHLDALDIEMEDKNIE